MDLEAGWDFGLYCTVSEMVRVVVGGEGVDEDEVGWMDWDVYSGVICVLACWSLVGGLLGCFGVCFSKKCSFVIGALTRQLSGSLGGWIRC